MPNIGEAQAPELQAFTLPRGPKADGVSAHAWPFNNLFACARSWGCIRKNKQTKNDEVAHTHSYGIGTIT